MKKDHTEKEIKQIEKGKSKHFEDNSKKREKDRSMKAMLKPYKEGYQGENQLDANAFKKW